MNPETVAPEPAPQPEQKNDRKKLAVIAAVILLVVIALIFGLTHKNGDTTTKKSSASNESSEKPDEGKLQNEEELADFKQSAIIDIAPDGITPQTLIVKKDTKIVWHNTDTKTHVLSISPGSAVPVKFFNDHRLEADGSYPYVAHQSGTFNYYLKDDPTKTGTVTIQ